MPPPHTAACYSIAIEDTEDAPMGYVIMVDLRSREISVYRVQRLQLVLGRCSTFESLNMPLKRFSSVKSGKVWLAFIFRIAKECALFCTTVGMRVRNILQREII